MNIAKFLRGASFYRTPSVAACKIWVWNLLELHHKEQIRLLLSCSDFFIDNLDHVHNWVGWSSKNSWKRLCECEIIITACMCCGNIKMNKKYQIIYIYIKLDNRIVFIYKKCKCNADLYCIIKNMVIYCKYILKFLVFEGMYFIFLY